jgi:hypothetical protein
MITKKYSAGVIGKAKRFNRDNLYADMLTVQCSVVYWLTGLAAWDQLLNQDTSAWIYEHTGTAELRDRHNTADRKSGEVELCLDILAVMVV